MTPPLTAADLLKVGAWFARDGQRFEITAWDARSPLQVEARAEGTDAGQAFTLTDLFAPTPVTRFAASRAELPDAAMAASAAIVGGVAGVGEGTARGGGFSGNGLPIDRLSPTPVSSPACAASMGSAGAGSEAFCAGALARVGRAARGGVAGGGAAGAAAGGGVLSAMSRT